MKGGGLMPSVPLVDKFQPLTEAPPEVAALLDRTKRTSQARALLSLLIQSPAKLQIGTCQGGADVIKLQKRIFWLDREPGAFLRWSELLSAKNGVHYLLQSAGLEYGVWCSCPDWLGGRRRGNYRGGEVPVCLGLVDKRKPLAE